MGEAKRRALARASAHDRMDEMLRGVGVDTTRFGFYDQPAFMEQEIRDGRFLERYAEWVQSRPRTEDYDARGRSLVPRLAGFLADLFEREGMQRSCVHASAMMPRILDRLGVWSFGLKGSMVMEVADEDLWRGQSMCDFADFAGAELGHAWVVAPPFVIVDPTVRLQSPAGDPMNAYLPPIVAVEEAAVVRPTVDDVVSAEMRAHYARQEGRADERLHLRLVPQLAAFASGFPAREACFGPLSLRYVPAGVRISDVELELINGAAERLTGAEVWNEHVLPEFAEYLIDAD